MSAQEFKVGDTVRGDDYDRLPVGSAASIGGSGRVTRGSAGWAYDSGQPCSPSSARTLTHLCDGTHSEPEDKDDLYVEPEPLKAGDWVWVAGQITETHQHPEDVTVEMFSHNEQYQADVRRDRVERMAGVPSWAKAAQNNDVEAIAEVLRSEGDMEYLASLSTAASLYRAGVRMPEDGPS